MPGAGSQTTIGVARPESTIRPIGRKKLRLLLTLASSLTSAAVFKYLLAPSSREPQFIASYNFQENSKVAVSVGNKTFSMFTRGKSAWMENAAEEPALIAAMKSGAEMKIAAKSGRGNPTNYVFSLKGISAALQSIANCK